MNENTSIYEIRKFCLECLSVVDKFYSILNEKNKKAHNDYVSKRNVSSEFLTKIKYALSFSAKAFMVAIGKGHFVSFETYKNYKERKQEKQKKDFFLEFMEYCIDLNNKMPQAIKSTIDLISHDDISLLKFYKVVMENSDCPDVIKPFIKGILACGAKLPFTNSDWDRYFDIYENSSSKDYDEFNYNTLIKNLFQNHKEHLQSNNVSTKKR